MASLSIAAFLRNNNNALITGPTLRVLLAVATKHFHVSTRMEESSVSDKATDAQEKVSKKAEEGANTFSDAAGNLKEKAKNAAEETWDKVTDTTEKIKDTVTGKSEETKDSIKALRRPSSEA